MAEPNVPEGYRLVPIVPTLEMLLAARNHRPHPTVRKPDHWDSYNTLLYQRMVLAARGVPGTRGPQPLDGPDA